jgi:hypothetical protein
MDVANVLNYHNHNAPVQAAGSENPVTPPAALQVARAAAPAANRRS